MYVQTTIDPVSRPLGGLQSKIIKKKKSVTSGGEDGKKSKTLCTVVGMVCPVLQQFNRKPAPVPAQPCECTKNTETYTLTA